ncbi:sugar phosphate isomerase/epimerase family protein [Paenibacillus gansuensis]|uniref:Sugar phosphate isomerase/epimerase family protein n=1 Tax=Paenibacillus gansuensis TaxID=306542 RepID=A0ABW5PF14_9BACL
MKLGLSTYTMTWSVGVPGYAHPFSPLSALGLIELAAEHGLKLVQFADNMPLDGFSALELDSLRKAAQSHGITLEAGTRGTDPGHLLSYLDICQRLDAKLCRTLITKPGVEDAERELRSVLPRFEQEGVVIAIENHGLHTTDELKGLFQSIESPFLGCCLDTVNSFGALETPSQVIETLLPFVVNLHIKDFTIQRVPHQMGFEILGTPAGQGRLPIPGLLEEISKKRLQPTSILELWTPFTGSVEDTIRMEQEWLGQSIRYLTSLPWIEQYNKTPSA